MRPEALRLGVEFVFVYFGLIGVYLLVDVPGGPIPVLLVAAIVALIYLRRQPGFDREDLLRRGGLRGLPPVVAAAAVLMVVAVSVWDPARLFDLPRTQPVLWAAIIVLYPLLSVYPQELLYRAFLLHRYAPLFGTGKRAAARRYQRSRSLPAAAIEHALYGVLIFTVGLGSLFYHGTR